MITKWIKSLVYIAFVTFNPGISRGKKIYNSRVKNLKILILNSINCNKHLEIMVMVHQ